MNAPGDVEWVYGLADMQSFYASCELAVGPEFAGRRQDDDKTDPELLVSGDPARRSGIILAATPTAKSKGVTTAMRLGEALRLAPGALVVRPHMRLYLDFSAAIQDMARQAFPLQEQYSVDEFFFAIPAGSRLFPDPVAVALRFQDAVWDCFRIRCRVGLAPNKWLAKMANRQAKEAPGGVVRWHTGDVRERLWELPVTSMWGLKRRARVLQDVFGARTIGDVARIPAPRLRAQFGVWGTVIHEWSHGIDRSEIEPGACTAPQKSFSHRTTLPQDFFRRPEIAVVILELLDEVCFRVRRAGKRGRRVGLGLTYTGLHGGFYRARTLDRHMDHAQDLYPHLLALLDEWWRGEGVRAITVSLDELTPARSLQISLTEDVVKRDALTRAIDEIHMRFGETSLLRAASLGPGSQLVERSRKIGGHYA